MKSLAFIFAFAMVTSSLVHADEPKNIGPEVINLKMGVMQLPFQHRKHQKAQKDECFHCHKADRYKIDEWSKKVAHELCISCHDLNENGPVECKGCHIK